LGLRRVVPETEFMQRAIEMDAVVDKEAVIDTELLSNHDDVMWPRSHRSLNHSPNRWIHCPRERKSGLLVWNGWWTPDPLMHDPISTDTKIHMKNQAPTATSSFNASATGTAVKLFASSRISVASPK
jgi:hypothetical protein